MYEVNRSVAIIQPKAPFFEWLNALPGVPTAAMTLASLRRDSNAILIPAADDHYTLEAYVMEHYHLLFQAELADWCDEEQYWPQEMGPELFRQWFDIETHPMLTDLTETPLEREQFQPLDLNRE